ncbi:MAG: sulfite exporter TauE/SafE family protein [Paracoccaceae bacterium]
MLDGLASAWTTPGLFWLIAATFVAGLVRGFAGFGTAMIYLPVATQIVSPVWAITTVIIFDIFGPMMIAPKALKDVHVPDLRRLMVGLVIGTPVGLLLLFSVAPEVFRYSVSIVTLILLATLIAGVRYNGPMSPPVVTGTGIVGGVLGGVVGIPGPPVIMLYMASGLPAAVVRATTMLYLLGYDIILIGVLLMAGRLEMAPLWIGVLLAVPNAIGNLAGAAIFKPGYERLYRGVAYAIIAASGLSGLPFWDS